MFELTLRLWSLSLFKEDSSKTYCYFLPKGLLCCPSGVWLLLGCSFILLLWLPMSLLLLCWGFKFREIGSDYDRRAFELTCREDYRDSLGFFCDWVLFLFEDCCYWDFFFCLLLLGSMMFEAAFPFGVFFYCFDRRFREELMTFRCGISRNKPLPLLFRDLLLINFWL